MNEKPEISDYLGLILGITVQQVADVVAYFLADISLVFRLPHEILGIVDTLAGAFRYDTG
jgi:hypothetical protein